MMKKIGDRGFVKGFFVLCVLVAIVFVGISFGKPYYRYYTLEFTYKGFSENRYRQHRGDQEKYHG